MYIQGSAEGGVPGVHVHPLFFWEKCLKIYPRIHFFRHLLYIVHPLFLVPCAWPVHTLILSKWSVSIFGNSNLKFFLLFSGNFHGFCKDLVSEGHIKQWLKSSRYKLWKNEDDSVDFKGTIATINKLLTNSKDEL